MNGFFKLSEEVIALVENHERFRATFKSVKNHTQTESNCDEFELDFEIIGLPQHRKISVNNVKPITIYIGKDNLMPVVRVRDDFPIVPHLNIHEDNITKSLCYADVSYEEIKPRMSGRFLLMCIENWFLKTSMNELHRPDQPIEPFFPYVNDVIIWNEKKMPENIERFALEDHEFGKLMYQNDEGPYYAVLQLPVPQDYSNLIHNMPKTLLDLLNSFGNFGNRDTLWEWLRFIRVIVGDDKLYRKYFNQSKNKLLACKVIINVAIPKSRIIDGKPESHDLRTFVTQETLKDILADYGLVLNGSRIDNSGKGGGYGANIGIHPFNVQHSNSRCLNKILNSINIECGNEQIVLIGAGALGSQILNNCLRAGYGEWTIIDNDYFWPHNIARHVLTSKDIGYTKVSALAEYALTIQADAKINTVTDEFFSNSDAISTALKCADIIVDVSASVAVEKYLALDTETTARQMSCFLNPSGTSTIMLLASSDGKTRLDLLEMQYYRELILNERYSNHMVLPETMVYSGSCRSISSRMSQDDVSLSAALCSKALKIYLSDVNGKIVIWTHEDDSVRKDIFAADNWVACKCDDWTVEISESLLEEIISDRTQSMPNETGGVLIGAFDVARKRVYIVCQIKAPDDSVRAPTSFIRGCDNLPQQLEFINRTTVDNLTYIGEWHSHLNVNTQKSMDDKKLHAAIVSHNRENCIPGCMLIIGERGYSIFIEE